MAKNLTKAEKIKKAEKHRKIKTTTKIVITIFGALVAIPALYALYVGTVFFLFPNFDYNFQYPMGVGYSSPLRDVEVDDDKEYVVAYYLDDYWVVIDDTDMLKKYKDKFIVYKSSDEWKKGSSKELYVFRNTECIVHTPLDSFVLIYDDFFMNSKKKMTMEEFKDYCDEKNFAGVYL